MPTDNNKYREMFSSGEALFSWKQPEDVPHMPVSSSLSVMTRSYIGSYVNIN